MDDCRDFGITVTKNLSPSKYISDIVKKAHCRANMIHRCFLSQNACLLVRAFTTYVRPLLEYNSATWSPSLKRDIQHIEQVQRRFTKRLRGFHDYSYAERLQLLNLDLLEMCRLKFDLILCYKIIFGIVRVNRDEFFEFTLSQTRGHPSKLYKRFTSCSVRSSFLVKESWNRLPVDTVDFSSLAKCNRSIDTVKTSFCW